MKKVLVVDDDFAMRKGIALRLEGKGYSVSEAENGNEALKHLLVNNFDLVILDLFLPGMDGIELGEKIKSICPGIKILLLTAHIESGKAKTAREIYGENYIEKNSLDVILLNKIEELINGRNNIIN